MTVMQLVVDALVVTVTAIGAWFYLSPTNADSYEYAILVLVALGLAIFSISSFGLYRSFRAQLFFEWLGRLTTAWLVVGLLVLVGLWAVKLSEDFSRLWLGTWFLAAWLGLILWRLSAHAILQSLRTKGYNQKYIVVVGAGSLGRSIALTVKEAPWSGFSIVAFFDDDSEKWNTTLIDAPVFSTTALIDWLNKNHVDEVWFALPLRAEKRLNDLLYLLRNSMVNIRYIPDLSSLRLLNHAPSVVLGFSMLDLSMSPMSEPANRLLKSIEDKVLSFIIIVLISPLLLLLALGVKLSSHGPIFYRQQRHGWNGEAFEMLKFRSMVVHSEQDGQVTQATVGDARITPFGAFLRRTSLDELPQFFNVLKGDMSIVGPRPHAIAHNDYYSEQIDGYMLRHKMKPGITGWAQVNGWRGETDTLDKMQKRVEFDLWYIEHWSLWLDIKIIIMTLFKGFVHSNAR